MHCLTKIIAHKAHTKMPHEQSREYSPRLRSCGDFCIIVSETTILIGRGLLFSFLPG
nr:MAG TPA: hypothetical protein [Caudoviricetes sp.]